MFLKKFMYQKIAGTAILLFTSLTVLAQTPAASAAPAAAPGSNMLAILLIVTAIVLVFVIWGMGQVLIALSSQLMDKTKENRKMAMLSIVLILSLLSNNVMAQTAAATDAAATVVPNYGGVSPNTFYLLVAVIVIEIFAVLFLFFSIRRVMAELVPQKITTAKKSSMDALWTKLDSKYFTKSIPVDQEADALLDHDYDGIQELDNSLPPWWKYGFIITIGFACVYILNFHVFGSGKNPTQEYAAEMASAQAQKEVYEANNKDKIDEANVPMADATGINKGKENYITNCVACHGAKGEGGAGPNLADDYWLHKGSLNAIYHTLKVGYAEKGMQSWSIKFNPKEMSEIASFVKTLKGTNPPNAKAPQGDLYTDETPGAIAMPADSLNANKLDSTIVKK